MKNKITTTHCPECGCEYNPEQAVTILLDNKIVPACPNCGHTKVRR